MFIRKASSADIKQLSLLEEGFHSERKKFLSKDLQKFDLIRPTSDFYNKLIDDDSLILVAEENKKIVGFIINKVEIFKFGKRQIFQGKIADLYVSKTFRKKGISSLLYEESLNWFRKKKCAYLQLTVYDDNSAKEIYRKWGFENFSIIMKQKITARK